MRNQETKLCRKMKPYFTKLLSGEEVRHRFNYEPLAGEIMEREGNINLNCLYGLIWNGFTNPLEEMVIWSVRLNLRESDLLDVIEERIRRGYVSNGAVGENKEKMDFCYKWFCGVFGLKPREEFSELVKII